MMSASQKEPPTTGLNAGIRVDWENQLRTSGAAGPRSSVRFNEHTYPTPPRGTAWKKQEIHHLLDEEFDVQYHPNYLPTFFDDLGLHYAIPRTKHPDRPENAEETLDERVEYALDEDAHDQPHNKRQDDDDNEDWDTDNDVCTDGGTVVGFLDISHPQPWDNSQRLYSVDKPHITRPLVKIDTPAAGFYALNGESVLSFPPNQEKEEICTCFERIHEQNPGKRILLVLIHHTCASTRESVHTKSTLISYFSRLARRISTQSNQSGRASSGSLRR